MENEAIVGSIKKGQDKTISISVGEYDGRVYVYSRIIKANRGDTAEAAYPWLTARPDVIAELIPLFQQALEWARKRQVDIGEDIYSRGITKRMVRPLDPKNGQS